MLWSWILAVVGLVGFILAGRKIWWCWYINIVAQVLWFAYALVTKQYGFIASSIVYAVVFSQNAYKWTKEYRERTLPKPPRHQRHLHIIDFDKREAWCPSTRRWREIGFGRNNCRECGWIFDSIVG